MWQCWAQNAAETLSLGHILSGDFDKNPLESAAESLTGKAAGNGIFYEFIFQFTL